jgi:hypothetical protein
MKLIAHLLVICLSLIMMSSFSKQEDKFLRYLESVYSLNSPGSIDGNTSIVSSNGYWKLSVQGDGNLVLKDKSEIVFWSTNTSGKGAQPYFLKLQNDANLVMYDSKGSPTWATNTYNKGQGPFNLSLHTDGNLVLYDYKGLPIWASNTNYVPVYPPAGCVWLFSECNFKGTKSEYCNNFASLDSSTSSILVPDVSVDCSSQSNCVSLLGNQSYSNFKQFDDLQNSKLTLYFDGYGYDFYVGIFSSEKSSSCIYNIVYGGWSNSQTKVFKSNIIETYYALSD